MIVRGARLLLCLTLLTLGCGTKDSSVPTVASSANPSTVSTAGSSPGSATVVLADGSRIAVEVVADPDTRAQGLMFRSSLSPDRGMLFAFPNQDVYPFWMKNTLIPLDMVWIDANRKVVYVASGVPPCTADPCPSYAPSGPSLYVLELAAGQAVAHSIKAGDMLTFQGTENIVPR